jgi:hypothetical protein
VRDKEGRDTNGRRGNNKKMMADWNDAALNQGTVGATRIWKHQEIDSIQSLWKLHSPAIPCF